jgi:hypothetical protein
MPIDFVANDYTVARIIDGQVVLAKTFLYTTTPYIIINGWSII